MTGFTISTIQVVIQTAGLSAGPKRNPEHGAFYQAWANWGICKTILSAKFGNGNTNKVVTLSDSEATDTFCWCCAPPIRNCVCGYMERGRVKVLSTIRKVGMVASS
jgi:hypothetical protein